MRIIKNNDFPIVTDGKINFGTYLSVLKKNNLLDTEFKLPIPRFLKSFRMKEWEAGQIGNERFFILFAFYNAKLMGVLQFLIFDKEKNKTYFYKKNCSPFRLKLADSLSDSVNEFKDKHVFFRIENRLFSDEIILNVKIKKTKNLPSISAIFKIIHKTSEIQPQIAVIPFSKNTGMYSHKALCRIEGLLETETEVFRFEPESSFAFIDDHKGFYPNPMRYDWGSGAGFVENRLIGFNLTDNQSTDSLKYNENCLWDNGILHLLPPIKFFRPEGVDKKWTISDSDKKTELFFTPTVKNSMKMNALIIKVDYEGPFGTFNGKITTAEGKTYIIDNYFGMGEKKYIRG